MDNMSFEQSFVRLEEILEKLNTDSIALEESLKLYEEANKLLELCNKRLNEAEAKIEVIVKSRSGEVELDSAGRPCTQSFASTAASSGTAS